MAAEAQGARRWTGVEALDLPLPVPAGHAPLSMRFCRIPAGSFRMGARGAETSQKSTEEPVHQVEVPYDFWMATYVVTQREYAAVFAALGLARVYRPYGVRWEGEPSRFKGRPDHPVEQVTWNDATLWCQKLSEWLQGNGPPALSPWLAGSRVVVSLPTEIEWEYACRAGTETEFWCGDDEEDLRRIAWFGEYYQRGSTHPVESRVDDDASPANAFGLVGVHGNVWEWCRDSYEPDEFAPHAAGRSEARSSDAFSSIDARYRVIRGGAWFGTAGSCLSAYRNQFGPGVLIGDLGFRVCLVRGPAARQDQAGGGAATGKRGAEVERAEQDKAGGARPPSGAAGETGAAGRAQRRAAASPPAAEPRGAKKKPARRQSKGAAPPRRPKGAPIPKSPRAPPRSKQPQAGRPQSTRKPAEQAANKSLQKSTQKSLKKAVKKLPRARPKTSKSPGQRPAGKKPKG
jgi:formylglycine-generating enzyme required for sulfatase activity